MPMENVPIFRFNAGLLSPRAISRIDLTRYQVSAEIMNNWLPSQIGSMMMRPGMGLVGETRNSEKTILIPFVYSISDTSLIEMTTNIMRIMVDDEFLTLPYVSTTITNGEFTSNLSGWSDDDDANCTSEWNNGRMRLRSAAISNRARRSQAVSVSGGDVGKKHCIKVNVHRGEVYIRVGSSSGGGEYVFDQLLKEGFHFITIEPTGTFYITVSCETRYFSYVSDITIFSGGYLEVPTTYSEHDLKNIRFAQSADVLFVACEGQVQRRIERKGDYSWSFVKYLPVDGPFMLPNVSNTTLTPSGKEAQITITASGDVFSSGHVGALIRIWHNGQSVSGIFDDQLEYTDAIKVTGVGNSRKFRVVISGTFSATVSLEKSYDEGLTWEEEKTYTSATSVDYDDGKDNETILYRLGIASGNYTSGTVTASLTYERGHTSGVARITGVTSGTSVTADVLSPFAKTTPSTDWEEGQWSGKRGYPSSVEFHEGRLFWSGNDRIVASASDAYDVFDDTDESDAAAFNRTIGSASIAKTNWMVSLSRLAVGGQTAEYFVGSNSLDDILTPSNFTIRAPSTQGSANVAALKVDNFAVFVQKSGKRLFQIAYDNSTYNFQSIDLTAFCPEVLDAGVVRMAVQRQPDTRIYCVLGDGTVAVFSYSKPEFQDVNCWSKIETDGTVEDVCVIPSQSGSDVVYFVVNRGGSRFIEKFSDEFECVGGTLNKQLDSFITYSGSATTSISGLGHLEGKTVSVWGDGKYVGNYTVSGGTISGISPSVSEAVAGLSYSARFKSFPIGSIAPIGWKNRITHVAFYLRNTHKSGLRFGNDFDYMDDLPLVEDGVTVEGDHIWDTYLQEPVSFPGKYTTNSRVCLEATSPKPCEVLGLVVVMGAKE